MLCDSFKIKLRAQRQVVSHISSTRINNVKLRIRCNYFPCSIKLFHFLPTTSIVITSYYPSSARVYIIAEINTGQDFFYIHEISFLSLCNYLYISLNTENTAIRSPSLGYEIKKCTSQGWVVIFRLPSGLGLP